MKKFLFDLQWFAEAGTLVNTTLGYRNAYTGDLTEFDGTYDLSTLNKTYFDTTLLDNARDQLIFAQLGKKQPLPANHGRTIEFRRWKTLGRVSQLTEGVIPTGKKMSQVAITCSLTQWGDYVTISDILHRGCRRPAPAGSALPRCPRRPSASARSASAAPRPAVPAGPPGS